MRFMTYYARSGQTDRQTGSRNDDCSTSYRYRPG